MGKCAIDGCGKERYYADGLCKMHHTRKLRHGDPLIKLNHYGEYNSENCKIEGCIKKRKWLGFCSAHARNLRKQGVIGSGKKCRMECNNVAVAHGLCEKHYMRERIHGDPSYLLPKDKTREKQRAAKLNNPVKYWKGKERLDISARQSGKNASNWKGGKSFEPYPPEFNNRLKKLIRKRDNYTCQECGRKQKEHETFGVHHIDYDKTNNKPSNLITLCKKCHAKTGFNRADWIKYFKEKLGNT